MLRTPLCDLLDITSPIVQGAIWPATAPKEWKQAILTTGAEQALTASAGLIAD